MWLNESLIFIMVDFLISSIEFIGCGLFIEFASLRDFVWHCEKVLKLVLVCLLLYDLLVNVFCKLSFVILLLRFIVTLVENSNLHSFRLLFNLIHRWLLGLTDVAKLIYQVNRYGNLSHSSIYLPRFRFRFWSLRLLLYARNFAFFLK